MTWGNLGSRLLGFAVLMPLALSRFTVEEANLWLIFQAIMILQSMADFGFSPTFIRIVSYARSGKLAKKSELREIDSLFSSDASMRRVIGTMRSVYNRLSLVAFFLMVVLGTLAVLQPIAQLKDITVGWSAWSIIVVSSVLAFRGGMFGVYMQGANQIALYQRWQIVTGTISIVAAVVALLIGGGLFHLVAIMQTGIIAALIVTRGLAVQHAPEGAWSDPVTKDREIMQIVWPAAWRSGLGVAMTFGTIQGTGVVYAQIAPAVDAAAFLLAQRVVRTLSSFANAPFYTRIPHMSQMYAEGRRAELVESARDGMLRSNWVLLAGIVVIGFAAEPLLALIGSQTPFVSEDVWWLLGLAALLERIGAMHLQLYSTTNHIVWHIANGISGLVMLISMPIAYHFFDVLGLPLGIVMAYAGFYVPYSLFKSYRTFHLAPFCMDVAASIVPLLLVVLFLLSTI